MGRTLTVPGRSVLPQSAGPAFNSTSAPLEAFGGSFRGLLQAGQQLGKIGDEMAAEALRIQQDENERVSKNLDIMYGEAIRKIQFGDGQSKGYFSEMGENAITNFGAASEALDKELQTIMGSTDNKRAVELFRRAADTRKLAALNSMSRHREQQQKIAAIATSEARVNSAVQDAAANWRDTKAVGLARATIMSEVMDQAEAQGWTPEIARDKLSTALSSMHEAAVMNAFRTDPIEAQLYYTTHLDDINGTTRTKIETLLEDGVMRTRAQEIADDVFAKFPNDEAAGAKYIREKYSGKLEQGALDTLAQIFSTNDRQRNRTTAEQKQQGKAQAVLIASGIMTLDLSESEALKYLEERVSGPMYNEVQSELRQRYAALERDQRKAVDDARSLFLTQMYTENKTLAQLQKEYPSEFLTLSGEKGAINDLQNTQKQIVEGRLYAPASDGETYDALRTMSQRDLAGVNLLEYRSRLTEEEYSNIQRQQTAASKALENKAESRSAYSAAATALRTYAPPVKEGGSWKSALTPELEQKASNQMTTFIEEYFDRWQKWPTDPEIQREAQRLMLPLVSDPPTSIGSIFNEITVGDRVFSVNADELTDEQVQYARVPYDRVPDYMVEQVRKVISGTGVPFSEELVERFAALRALNKRDEAEVLLGVRR